MNGPAEVLQVAAVAAVPALLVDAREITRACFDAANGRGGYVYADVVTEGTTTPARWRVVQARRRGGELQVMILTTADRRWYPAAGCYRTV